MEFGDFSTRSGGLVLLGFLAAMVIGEAIWLIVIRRRSYDWKAAGASFGVALGKRVIDAVTAGIAGAALFWVYQFRPFTITLDSFWAVALLILLFELAYYWHHRLAHEVRWLWATHSVHHSPEEMNLSVSARLGWTGLFSGSFLFFAPLVYIGFHPIAVFLMLALSLFYQIWIHTELVNKLPRPLEWLMNTPSHHRVHHACNRKYLDKNYGGTLILWDRVFGTFTEETDQPKYGLTDPVISYNPIRIALTEWGRMTRDVIHARNWDERFAYLFSPPGWTPERPRKMTALRLYNPFTSNKGK